MLNTPLLVLASLCWFALAPPAAAKGKRHEHPKLHFRVQLPDGWKSEPAETGLTISPPGIVIDPKREDNPEVYSVWAIEYDQTTEEDYIKSLRERFKQSGVKLAREGDLETFSSPGRPGVIYTFDFVHPERKAPFRIRVFALQHKGKPLLLIANGELEKLAARDKALREIARSFEW